MNKLKKILINKKVEWFMLLILLIASGIARGYNMFHYPAYFDDEGTYMAQAWAFIVKGQLSHYTYWYDHPPLSWIQIGIWSMLTGGFERFGTAINSGRTFILLLAILSDLFVYLILRQLKCTWVIAGLGMLLFGLSPFGIQFGRMVFLDNIMSFWVLLSTYLILKQEKRLSNIILSGVCFGVAFLSKEVAIVFMLPLIILIYHEAHPLHRSFALIKWIAISVIIMVSWILFAQLRGEFFPMGSLFDAGGNHVSLISTIQYQLSRKGNGGIFYPTSDIRNLLQAWTSIQLGDLLLIGGGLIAAIFNLFIGIKNRYSLIFALFPLCFLVFFGRGGQVFTFYILPLLPFLAINIALLLSSVSGSLSKLLHLIKLPIHILVFDTFFAVITIFSFVTLYKDRLIMLETKDQTTPQTESIYWIGKHIDPKSFIVVDDYAYVDLYYRGFLYPNPIYYWKVERDPAVKDAILKGRWDKIDYILLTPSVKSDVQGFSLLKKAVDNSVTVKTFYKDGYNIVINQVQNSETMLKSTWNTYKNHFISSSGFTNDQSSSSLRVTSESQSYSLIKAVLMNDRKTFDKVLSWSVSNMKNNDMNLFAWWYGEDKNGKTGITDKGTASDADEDIAISLIFAYKQWKDITYLNLAKSIINDIWKYETVDIGGKRYLVAGDWASKKENKIFTVNPSYLSPYAYRIFAKVDKNHNWGGLVDTSYELLQKCSNSNLGVRNNVDIPPDWCGINKDGGIVATENFNNVSTDYSYDAMRTVWRIALDYQWNKEKRALNYLKNMSIWSKEWESKQKIFAVYTHNGVEKSNIESLAHYGTQLAFFSVTNKIIADDVYEKKVFPQYHMSSGEAYWGDKNNYYDQNWVWFGIALYTNKLPNIWK